jgi:hypothetical protein
MPKHTHYIVAVLLLVMIVNFGAVYFGQKHAKEDRESALLNATSSLSDNTPGSTTTPSQKPIGSKPLTSSGGTVAGYYSYTNSPYSFSIQYPSYIQPLFNFATFHEIGNNWRLNAGPANQGKPIVSFSIHNIDQGIYSTGKQTYPLYFTAEVRVGVSTNVKDCYAVDAGYPNQKITNVTINGATFKKFSSSDAGMMKYTQAESYRTIHNNSCYVLEQIKSGTSYRDEKMSLAYTDVQLENYYKIGDKIIKTFKFTK